LQWGQKTPLLNRFSLLSPVVGQKVGPLCSWSVRKSWCRCSRDKPRKAWTISLKIRLVYALLDIAYPVIRPRKKSEDYCAVLRTDLIIALLDKEMAMEFATEVFRENNGSATISVLPFGIAANGQTLEAAAHEAVEDVIDYVGIGGKPGRDLRFRSR
jgi:hypothetical protein